jgi:LPS-assembly lipoprotein
MRLVRLTFLAAALVGCGFHLRGSAVETNIASAYVRAAPNITVNTELTRILKQSGVQILDSEQGAAVVIDLLDQQQTSRTVSYTDRATTAESELDLRVHFKVVAAGGKVLIDDRWAHATRTYLVDTNNLVGSNQQAQLLTSELLTDCAQQIIRGLSASTRVKPV